MDAVSATVPSFTRILFKEELHMISPGIARCRESDDAPSTVVYIAVILEDTPNTEGKKRRSDEGRGRIERVIWQTPWKKQHGKEASTGSK